ncbi:MAG TPA: SGNH/GDSL hydrolase family protein [Aggregatilineales bacterium]|nr:SGNH/GDSL hydrolase family protein [Aggregatilineales bacterium]
MIIRKLVISVLLLAAFGLFVPAQTQAQSFAVALRSYPVVPVIGGAIYAHARALYLVGRRLGNRADVFSKLGDSITAWPYFLTPVGAGGLRLGIHPELATVFNYFSRDMARTNNSFANQSLGAFPGWTTYDILDPAKAARGICTGGATPIDCELGVSRPSIALIMIGTNDLPAVDVNSYYFNLNRIVSIVESHGVIPVLSTLPRRKTDASSMGKLDQFNQAVVSIAAAHHIPLWNYWLAMEDLPANGISVDQLHPSLPPDGNTGIFDGAHLSFGWTARNLTAMQVLNSLLVVVAR